MKSTHVCTLVFALAFMKCSTTATPVLASSSGFEKQLLSDPLALGRTSIRDDQCNTQSNKSRSRDLGHAHNTDLIMSRPEAGYSLCVSERSLLTDLTSIGFRLVWDYMDIAYASYMAFHRTTELWANITADAQDKWKVEKSVMRLDICYGSLKLSIAGLIDAISWELVAAFAAEMLVLSRIVAIVAFRLFVFANWAALVITLAISAQILGTIKPQQLVTSP